MLLAGAGRRRAEGREQGGVSRRGRGESRGGVCVCVWGEDRDAGGHAINRLGAGMWAVCLAQYTFLGVVIQPHQPLLACMCICKYMSECVRTRVCVSQWVRS